MDASGGASHFSISTRLLLSNNSLVCDFSLADLGNRACRVGPLVKKKRENTILGCLSSGAGPGGGAPVGGDAGNKNKPAAAD
jgi:hypothetical protein